MRSFSQRTGLKVNGFIIQGNAHYIYYLVATIWEFFVHIFLRK